MSAGGSTDDVAEELTAALLAVDGVRGIFPGSVVAAAVTAVRGARGSDVPPLVEVAERDGGAVVTARLAVESAASSAATVLAAGEAVRRVLGDRPFELQVQIAYID